MRRWRRAVSGHSGADPAPGLMRAARVAVFGDFRYKSLSLGKVVGSPFSILVRKDGTWTVRPHPAPSPSMSDRGKLRINEGTAHVSVQA